MMREDEALSVVEVASFLEFLSPSLVVLVCGFVLAFLVPFLFPRINRGNQEEPRFCIFFYSNSVKDLSLDQLFSSIFRKPRILRYVVFQVGKRNLRRAVFMKKKESYIFPSFFFFHLQALWFIPWSLMFMVAAKASHSFRGEPSLLPWWRCIWLLLPLSFADTIPSPCNTQNWSSKEAAWMMGWTAAACGSPRKNYWIRRVIFMLVQCCISIVWQNSQVNVRCWNETKESSYDRCRVSWQLFMMRNQAQSCIRWQREGRNLRFRYWHIIG